VHPQQSGVTVGRFTTLFFLFFFFFFRSSQYFTSRSGRLLKWKRLANNKLEVRFPFPDMSAPNFVLQCVDGKEVLATYETGQLSGHYSAMLTIRQAGLAVVTEILTTLMLSQMATVLQWRC
jgi:hypothetical protein